jgi:lysine---8-amino-7-oxononanoate aminotransferase
VFAIEREEVVPDMVVMANGLSGGYLPLIVTVISGKLFSAFDGSKAGGKALPHRCITTDQITKAVNALRLSITEVCGEASAIARKNGKEITA